MATKKKPILQSDVMKARAAADAVLRKAVADSAFRKQLKQDPVGVLKKAGVPIVAIEDVRREIILDGKALVSACTETCMMTCLITCFVTGSGHLPGGDVINPGQ